MGLFSFIGGILGGGSAKKGAERGMQAQVDALNRGIDLQQDQFDQTRQDFMPWRKRGKEALGDLGILLGLSGHRKQDAAIEALRASPFYQQLYGSGEEAILANASATGGIRGGNTQGFLADFGADTLMKTIEHQLANLGGLAGMGMGATESVANFGARATDNITNLYGKQGDARSDYELFRGGVNAQNWNNAGGFLDKAFSAIF